MKRLVILAVAVALVASAPVSNETSSQENILTINEEFFPDELKIFTSEYDIIDILFPINFLNFDESEDDTDDGNKILFFVEADIANGVEYKGLSAFKNGIVTKILPTGTSISADNDDSKTAYFGATDGLYKYNTKKNTAEKHGPITDSIIDIAKANGTDLIYILTDKNILFKVTENGTKKEEVVDVVGAKEIALDYANNLYYYGQDNKPYVVGDNGTKRIEGLPSTSTYIKLMNPAFVIEDGVPIIFDNKAYIIYANGSSEFSDIEFEVKPSAYSIDATLVQYYAYKKSIYEYNILMLILGEALEDLKAFLSDMQDQIQEIATRSISSK